MADSILARARPLLAARLAGAALTFAVPLVLARALLPADYGTFKQAWLVSQTLVLVLPMGLVQSLYYFVPRDPGSRDRYVAQVLWAGWAVGLVAAALLLAGRPLVDAHFGNAELTRTLPWVAAFTALTLFGAPLDIAWNAQGRVGAAAVARAATEGTRALGMIAGARLAGTVDGVFAGIAAAAALRALVTGIALGRRHGLAFDAACFRRQAAYALPFGAAFLLVVPQQQWHPYAVAAAVPAAAFAIYSVGTFQLPVVDVLYTPISELLQVGLAEQEGAGRPPSAGLALFHEAVLQLAFVFVPTAGVLVVVAPDLIPLLFSPRYAAAVPIFRLATASVLLAALPLDAVMRARAQNRFLLGLSAVRLALTAALVAAGLAAWGPIGALAGWLAADATARLALLWRTARLFEAGVRQVLPFGALARLSVATGAGAAAAALAREAVAGPAVPRVAAASLAFGAVYLGLSWARGWLPAGWAGLFRSRRSRAAPAGP